MAMSALSRIPRDLADAGGQPRLHDGEALRAHAMPHRQLVVGECNRESAHLIARPPCQVHAQLVIRRPVDDE